MTTEIPAAQTGASPAASGAAPNALPSAAGPAHEAAHHWGVERMTSLATLLLFVWFFVSLWRLPGLDQQTIAEWLKNPLVAVPMLLLIVSTFWHLKDGLVVVVDDYAHQSGNRFALVLVINLLSLFAAGLALFAVLKLALAGTPA
jgi:succinate dehydrogenase / fumarate reductase membrane anchor subunit